MALPWWQHHKHCRAYYYYYYALWVQHHNDKIHNFLPHSLSSFHSMWITKYISYINSSKVNDQHNLLHCNTATICSSPNLSLNLHNTHLLSLLWSYNKTKLTIKRAAMLPVTRQASSQWSRESETPLVHRLHCHTSLYANNINQHVKASRAAKYFQKLQIALMYITHIHFLIV